MRYHRPRYFRRMRVALSRAGIVCLVCLGVPPGWAADQVRRPLTGWVAAEGRWPIADVELSSSQIVWKPFVAYQSLILTVSLPGGLVVRNEFQPGETVIFKAGMSVEEKDDLLSGRRTDPEFLKKEQSVKTIESLQDGVYHCELTIVPRPESLPATARERAALTPLIQTEHFRVHDGAFIVEREKEPQPSKKPPAAKE